jgi:hypothetical protein
LSLNSGIIEIAADRNVYLVNRIVWFGVKIKYTKAPATA